MTKFFQGVMNFFLRAEATEEEKQPVEQGELKIVVGREEIERILPHRGRALLLDEVVITPSGMTGRFVVTEEVCEGHDVLNGKLLKGSDFLDMAAQLVGIWASRNPHLQGYQAVVRSYGGSKFYNPARPGELLELRVEAAHLSGEVGIRGSRSIAKVRGEKFVASANGGKKAIIEAVELALFAPFRTEKKEEEEKKEVPAPS